MVNKNIKYEPIKSSDLEEGELNPKRVKCITTCFQTHWTLMLLLLSVIIIQFFYYIAHKNEYDQTYPSTNQAINDASNDIELRREKTESELFTNRQSETQSIASDDDRRSLNLDITPVTDTMVNDCTTIASRPPPTTTLSGKTKQNRTFLGTSGKSYNVYTTKLVITVNVNEDNDANGDSSVTQDIQATEDAITTYSILKRSHHITDLTTEYSMVTSSTFLGSYKIKHLTTTTSIINYSNATTHSTPTTTTLGHWSTTIPPPIFRGNSTRHSNHAQKDERSYNINTSQCHIPNIDPFTPAALKIFKPSHSTGCTKDEAIVTASFDEVRSQYILHINYTAAMTFVKQSNAHSIVDDLQCCYRQIERSGSGKNVDKKFKLLPCTNFHQDFLVPLHIQGVIIDCKSKSMGKLLQQDAFFFIQANNQTINEKERKADANGPRQLGVLLIGIDSLSRINFQRTMPQTFKYLVDKQWFEMKGYTKVGDNTYPNLMSLLTGYDKDNAYSKCKPTIATLDKCNLIWTKFKENGFKTAYAEDSGNINTFNYLKRGFENPPTDHYFRPNILALEKTMKTSRKASIIYCVGRRQSGEYIYDYGWEFATRYRNHSNFGLFWTNSFSHNSFSLSATMDNTMMNYLKALETKGILETSVVIFFNDHGRRWGPLLKLPEAFFEERLPMFFVSLPSWMNSKYPNYVKNVKVNQKRLVTPFDIHMTLQDLLHLAVPEYNVTQAYNCPKAKSIFEEIPENRTCEDACIPKEWCACEPYKAVSHKSDTVKKVTQLIVNEMNHYFVTKNITNVCSNLTIHEITAAKIRGQNKVKTENVLHYKIEFITAPLTKPATMFDAVVDYNQSLDKIQLKVEDIARHSVYEKTAKCIVDKEAKKYCICKASLIP